jgi:phosphate transport system ATP-binding protein
MKNPIIELSKFSIHYGNKQAVKEVDISFMEHDITAIIGPSGCGKSSLLRSLNRMNDFVDEFRLEGEVRFRGQNIYSEAIDPIDLRRRVGMVFQKPNPFPKTIYNNIVWGPKMNYYQGDFDQLVETSLRKAALWDEVKDRLHESALRLSGGQQQRLCIARAIAMNPDVLLMDEPCSALDPIATEKIEELILSLKKQYTILIVTHNMHQAARISDTTLFFCDGLLIEAGATNQVFELPKSKKTRDYVSGLFG